MARRGRREGRAQGRDDRLGRRPARLAAAHPQQGSAARRWRSGSRTPTTRSSIVIVRDMWLTGFDAPCLHTMYVDKPMRGHGLMQAIARVNRVFRDKPGGLVVDYLGLADELKQALADLHRERRHRRDGDRPGRGRRGDAGEVRDLPRHVPRLRLLSPLTHGHGAATDLAAPGGAGAHSRAGTTARSGCCKP